MAFLIVAFPVTAPASRLQLGGVVVPKDQLRGAGDSVEEPLTGRADGGGMQLQVYPRSAEAHHASSQEETIGQAP